MNVVVTGAAGFLGGRVADVLLAERSPLPVARLLLLDRLPPPPRADPRVVTLAVDLAEPGAAARVLPPDCHVLFHLAAAVSGQAEADFELGMRVNFDATRELAEAARRLAPGLRFVFTSSIAVYGGDVSRTVDESTAVTPQTSYGAQKAMCELLLNDYGRRGYVDARIVRLPTVSVRAGAANTAVTSFASAIVREPLAGEPAVCPVAAEQAMWLSSPGTTARNIVRAGALPAGALGAWRALLLPGLRASVREMLEALRAEAGAAAAALVRFERDEAAVRMVASLPSAVDTSRALGLGFEVDESFAEIIRTYIKDDLGGLTK